MKLCIEVKSNNVDVQTTQETIANFKERPIDNDKQTPIGLKEEHGSSSTSSQSRSTNGVGKATGLSNIYSPSHATNPSVKVQPGWKRAPLERIKLNDIEAAEYNHKIRENMRERLGEEGYYSYQLLGDCYIHGMMDGEAMLHQNEGWHEPIPSMVFEIR